MRFVLAGIVLSFATLACTGCREAAPRSTPRPAAPMPSALVAPGVSLELARYREARLRDVRYELRFEVPPDRAAAVVGTARIRFVVRRAGTPIVLDFAHAGAGLRDVTLDGRRARYAIVHDHVTLAERGLPAGEHVISLGFVAGTEPLHRDDDALYMLFVPDRAHFAFPCFDQPDLRAAVSLALRVPPGWTAVANGREEARTSSEQGTEFRFARTRPLPTYLMAFVTGKFEVEEADREGRHFRMFHRESDAARVLANRDAIFDLHMRSIAWMEQYTGIPHPFDKYDFVAIPSFEFGGMEHAGVSFYSASSLFLEPTATDNDRLDRAGLVAHETSHAWFGNLVTMRWFDDVWMKEVFAGSMAARIVEPAFPDVDHPTRFVLAHHPAAYGVDRSRGSVAIRQPLSNLADASMLYGAAIYHKAPVALRQLERRVGQDAFRRGIRTYLSRYRFGNAAWPELIAILDPLAPDDLAGWSRTWIESPNRPTITTLCTLDSTGRLASLGFVQSDPARLGRTWPQRLDAVMVYPHALRRFDLDFVASDVSATEAVGLEAPLFTLANGDGLSYGDFVPDAASLDGIVAHLSEVDDDRIRAVAWLTLWDAMLDGRLPPRALVDVAARLLESESNVLVANRVLVDLGDAFWRFLPEAERRAVAPRLERILWKCMMRETRTPVAAAYFAAFRRIALSSAGVSRLEKLWRNEAKVPALELAERDRTALAQELALREVPGWEAILEEESRRISDPERRARFEYARPALSADPSVRDAFFATLADPEQRRRSEWVLDAVGFLHHPLRAARSERYIRPSLDLLEEIQRTGDIFFPLAWLNATLGGHDTETAMRTVDAYLADRPDLDVHLRMKVLQAADGLERSARILGRASP